MQNNAVRMPMYLVLLLAARGVIICLKVMNDDNNLAVTVRAQQSAVKLMFWFATSSRILTLLPDY